MFRRTQRGVDWLVRRLNEQGVAAEGLHGALGQGQRERTMQDFRDGRVNVLVATNVAVLRLNMRLDHLARERADLRAKNAELSSQLSSAASTPRIQALAARSGLVQATPQQTHYFALPR